MAVQQLQNPNAKTNIKTWNNDRDPSSSMSSALSCSICNKPFNVDNIAQLPEHRRLRLVELNDQSRSSFELSDMWKSSYIALVFLTILLTYSY